MSSTRASIAASLKALLVVAGGLVVRVDNSVGGDPLSIPHLSPSVNGVHIAKLIVPVHAIAIDGEHGALEGRELTNVVEPRQTTKHCKDKTKRPTLFDFIAIYLEIVTSRMIGSLCWKINKKSVNTTNSHSNKM